ncbi:Uncharacterised protein [Chlamydia trachomatis]|nr:Uncharacterised protein [Chlamydia trachomatis]
MVKSITLSTPFSTFSFAMFAKVSKLGSNFGFSGVEGAEGFDGFEGVVFPLSPSETLLYEADSKAKGAKGIALTNPNDNNLFFIFIFNLFYYF